MLKLALTPRWLAGLLLALAFATGFMMLSQWQLGSASSKQVQADPAKEVVAPLEEKAAPLEPVLATEADSMVWASGHYVQGSTVLVADRVSGDRQGYWAVARFVPDEQPAPDQGTFSVAVARGFTEENDPAAFTELPEGEQSVVGRLVANEGPVTTEKTTTDTTSPLVLGSAATAELANVWEAPLYSGIVAADAEVSRGAALPLDAEGRVREDAGLASPHEGLTPLRTTQYTDSSVSWLNVFYGAEWVVFAGFALYLWWRMLGDARQRQLHPERYYESVPAEGDPEEPGAEGSTGPGAGQYFFEESSGRFYYWDPRARQHFYYDDDPAAGSGPETSGRARGTTGPMGHHERTR